MHVDINCWIVFMQIPNFRSCTYAKKILSIFSFFAVSFFSAWFEELRKRRVAELKRELEKSDDSIWLVLNSYSCAQMQMPAIRCLQSLICLSSYMLPIHLCNEGADALLILINDAMKLYWMCWKYFVGMKNMCKINNIYYLKSVF